MKVIFILVLITAPFTARAQESEIHEHHHSHHDSPESLTECGSHMEVWDPDSNMCQPRAMPGMGLKQLMVHGNGFGVAMATRGARGRQALAAPHMAMIDFGQSLADRHFINLELMLTAERWSFPIRGYPELLQVGEHDEYGGPFVDATSR